jgi:uncharacterized protein
VYTLIVFAKLPILGQVKTRIAAHSSDEFALNLHSHLLSSCILQAQLAAKVFTQLTDIPAQVHWHYAGTLLQNSSRLSLPMQSLIDARSGFIPQDDSEDLGVKMHSAIAGYKGACVLFGSDIPALDSTRLLDALMVLHKEPATVVLNPTEDGGYCLIGKGADQALGTELFSGIRWSTPEVMVQTRERLVQSYQGWVELAPVSDIDDLEAAERYLLT